MMLGGFFFKNKTDYETMHLLSLTNKKLKNIVQPRLTAVQKQRLLCIEAKKSLVNTVAAGWIVDILDSDMRVCRHEAFMVRVYNHKYEVVIEMQPRVFESGVDGVFESRGRGMFKLEKKTKWLGYCDGILKVLASHEMILNPHFGS